jgi:hypothetical protein
MAPLVLELRCRKLNFLKYTVVGVVGVLQLIL